MNIEVCIKPSVDWLSATPEEALSAINRSIERAVCDMAWNRPAGFVCEVTRRDYDILRCRQTESSYLAIATNGRYDWVGWLASQSLAAVEGIPFRWVVTP